MSTPTMIGSTKMDAVSASAPARSVAWRTDHPLTVSDRAAMAALRMATAPNKGKLRGVAARPMFNDIIGHTSQPKAVSVHEDRVGGVPGWWCEPADAVADRVVLHIHGGWFNWGSAEAFRNLVGHIAQSATARAFIPDYRLAPEHAFPAAPTDVTACLDGLLERGANAVAVTGDSAGGNLALLALSHLATRPQEVADCVVGAMVFSPVTDLTLSGKSWSSRADADPFFVRDQVQGLVEAYLAGHDPADPAISPLSADPAGFPPVRAHVGDAEVLLDDSLRWVERAVAAGVDARVHVWDGMPHGFLGSPGQLQAADAAFQLVGSFLQERFASRL
jgi:acetyl esterase/lipase